MKIIYRPGKAAVMPDALSRRSDYHEGKGATEHQELNFTQALPNDEPMPSFLQAMCKVIEDEAKADSPLEALLRAVGNEEEIQEGDLGLPGKAEIMKAQQEDPELDNLREALTRVNKNLRSLKAFEVFKRRLRNTSWTEPSWAGGQPLSIDEKTYISGREIRGRVIKSRHNAVVAGHLGIEKTLELMACDYTWVGMGRDVELYVKGCLVCQRMKGHHGKRSGYLKTLEVAEKPWQHLSMDFIDQLPKSHYYDTILVVVD